MTEGVSSPDSGSALTPQQEELLARQEAMQFRTQLFQTESQEITEKGKAYQAAHDAMLALIAGITGR